jgi:predicted house-cleaning NTP pyrophosphatase (Maf/HAM1 superfamily)
MASPSDRLVLVSASPVRARLLAAAGVDFRVEPAEVDETAASVAASQPGSADRTAVALTRRRELALRTTRIHLISSSLDLQRWLGR